MEFILSQFAGLGTLTAYYTLRYNHSASQALLDLEFGRGLIVGVTIDSRFDVSDLKNNDHGLYKRYTSLRDQVFSTLTWSTELSTAPSETVAADLSRRNLLINELQRVEIEIQALGGLSNFQGLQSENEIIKLALDGAAIVCFNVTEYTSQGFFVTSAGISGFRLDIDYKDVLAHVKALIRGQALINGPSSTKAQRNNEVRRILKWLWTRVVKPILRELKLFTPTPPKKLPRLWWVNSGLLGLLPLHAAGSAWGVSRENAASHVVSSYVPTFKSLRYARDKKVSFREGVEREFLFVTMRKTEGFKKVLAVEKEKQGVEKNLSLPGMSISSLDSPTRREVIERLKPASIAHFVCHGVSEALNPSNSSLVLKDGHLTVRNLASLSIEHAQIAYLSACSTAENRTTTLADESLHIASAFHLVGFPHVLGTLWPADDKIAQVVAPSFYRFLSGRVKNGEDGDDAVAYAFHDAVTSLWKEKKWRNNPIGWATFIHIGA